MRFSTRSGVGAERSPFARAVQSARAAGALLDLTPTNPTRVDLPTPTDATLAMLSSPTVLDHSPAPFGLGPAREAVAAATGADPDRVLLTASTSESYGLLFRLLCDPGDVVLAPEPGYPLFDHLARFDGVGLERYPLLFDGAWSPSIPDAVEDNVRGLLVVSPNNPTGTVFRDPDWAAVRRLGLPVIVDEVFAPYPLEGPSSDAANVSLPLRFVLGGLSKSCGLPQLKLGWIRVEGDDALVREALDRLAILADAYLSVGTPVQVAAKALLEAGAPFREATRVRLSANLATLRAATEGTVIDVPTVDGGWYACLRVPATQTDEVWALALLERGVVVQPGYLFDLAPGEWLVVSLLTPEATFTEGMTALVRHVEAST